MTEQIPSVNPSQPSSARSGNQFAVVCSLMLLLGLGIGLLLGFIGGRLASRDEYQPPIAPSTSVPSAQAFVASTIPVKPVLPIKAAVRKAAMGEGFVVTFTNDGERHIKLNATHKRTSLNQASVFSLRLDPGKSSEVGWAEGHVFYPGDTIVLEHADFRRRVLTVNPGKTDSGIDVVEGTLP